MKYEKPRMEFWDLEEDGEIIFTSLSNGGENKENGSNGDFDGGSDDIDWGSGDIDWGF